MIKIIVLLFICFSVSIAAAQDVHQDTVSKKMPDSTTVKSPIQSLTYDEYMNYKNGKSVELDKAAELNNYPGPIPVLDLQKELKLTADQKSQVKTIYGNLKRKAIEMGDFILKEEKKLNDMFAAGKANEGSIIYYTNKIGLFQGELRNAYLQAHLKVRQLLTPEQLNKYKKLRANIN